ncbi:MAG: hypothetical protein ACYSWZ_27085, partial [Planctomycetota bacterium]
QPVDPEDLLRHVKFYDDKSSGELGGAICLTKKPEEKLVVRVRRPHSNKMRIVLDERLAGHEAELSLDRKIVRTLAIASGFSLLNTRTDTPNLDEIISVRLQFSHRLNREQKIPKITVEPSVEKLKVLRSYRTLRVNGKFEPGKSYKIKVPGHEKGFLSPLGNLTLDIKAANVEAINFKSWRVHQNNLVPHLHGNSAGITSRFLLEKTVKVNTPHNKVEKLAVNLQELIPGGKGIYRIKASATNRKWYSAPALVTITDLAITAKTERNGSLVWVTSLRTGKPVAGVRLMALTHNNQTLATAKTDASGIARLKFTTSGPDGGLWVITAEKDDDLSYLRPADNRWVINDVEQSGRAYIPPTFPLAVKVIRPDGRQIDEIITEHKENSQGIFHIKFPTRNDGQTGSYRFRVTLPGSKQILGSTHVFVEAFVPLRMEVKSEPTAERFGPNEPPTVNVSGRYLWDQPAAKLPVKVQGSLRKIAFNSKKYPDFHFSTGKKSKHISVPTCTGQLDNQGKTNLEIQPPKSLEAGIYRMALSATVTETGGRSVSSNMSAILDNLDHHIGLRLPTGRMVEANEPVSVDWVSLTGDEKPNGPGEMEVRLVEVEYDTVLKEVNRRRVWQSVEKINEIKTRQISMTADSKGSFQITCPDAGKYRIIVTDKKTKSGTKLDFYACEHAAGPQSLAMNQPERLEVVTEKKTYLPGETAKVLVRSPLPGTLLLTVETDHVVDLVIAEM